MLTFAGLFADQGYTDQPGSVSSDGYSPRAILAYKPNEDLLFTAQVARGFRLGGINDPLNVTLCTAEDLTVYDGHPTWDDEETTNYELGAKTRWADGRVQFNAAVFMTEIEGLQVIADAGSCSSRIILNAEGESIGGELEVAARPNENWDFAVSATYADATITKTQFGATGEPIAGIRDGNRLPTSPELQAAASATYSWPWGTALIGYVNFTVQHVGSSFTQLADQEPGFGVLSTDPTGNEGHNSWIRRSVDHRIRLRGRIAGLPDRQPALWRARRSMGTRGVREQRLGRTRLPVDRSRAKPQRTGRLPDQCTTHLRLDAEPRLLSRIGQPRFAIAERRIAILQRRATCSHMLVNPC